jgi:hypothetical protein
MDAGELRRAAEAGERPSGLPEPLVALWELARGDWDAAHGLVQDDQGADAAWVHAHLHRVEGDDANAGYWYRRARRTPSRLAFDEEWHEIAEALLHG